MEKMRPQGVGSNKIPGMDLRGVINSVKVIGVQYSEEYGCNLYDLSTDMYMKVDDSVLAYLVQHGVGIQCDVKTNDRYYLSEEDLKDLEKKRDEKEVEENGEEE